MSAHSREAVQGATPMTASGGGASMDSVIDPLPYPVEGLATLMRAEDTGMTVNEMPRARLVFEVNAPDVQPFELCVNRLVLHAHGPRVGAVVCVWFDPADPARRHAFDEDRLAALGVRVSGRG